jgi:sulfate/thiosulfate transport system ATP-binding protein
MTILLTDISKRFGGHVALDNVSLEIPRGSLTALLGPSGSGKTTLLRIIAGLEEPDAGRVVIDGADVTNMRPQRRGIGFVFQHYAAFKHMTVRDNVGFGLSVRRLRKADIRRRVDEVLAVVQLEGLDDRYPAQLSGGQRQRMAFARALAVDPSVLLLDEPFGALDARVRSDLRHWLRRLHERTEVTTVLVTHDQEEAMEVADRIAVMDHAAIRQVGPPRELYDDPSNAFVMEFFGTVNRVGDAFVRPHDLKLHRAPNGAGNVATVERVVHLGFVVRADLLQGDGKPLVAQLTADEAEHLRLQVGDNVVVAARRERVFLEGEGI